MELSDHSVMARLHQSGRPSHVLQIALGPLPAISDSHAASIIRRSQNEHSRARKVVETRMRAFLRPDDAKVLKPRKRER